MIDRKEAQANLAKGAATFPVHKAGERSPEEVLAVFFSRDVDGDGKISTSELVTIFWGAVFSFNTL
jgi:hypothetical protein